MFVDQKVRPILVCGLQSFSVLNIKFQSSTQGLIRLVAFRLQANVAYYDGVIRFGGSTMILYYLSGP